MGDPDGDQEMTTPKPQQQPELLKSPLESHEAAKAAIRAAVTSNELDVEAAATSALSAVEGHEQKLALLGSTLDEIRATCDLPAALRIVQVANLLPIGPRPTLLILEHITTRLTTKQLSLALPQIQTTVDAILKRWGSKAYLFVIRLMGAAIARDAHASDAALTGRLRLLLGRTLPAWHPSGMNRRGQYREGWAEGWPCREDPSLQAALSQVSASARNATACESGDGWKQARDAVTCVLDAFDTGAAADLRTVVCVQAAVLLQHVESVGATADASRQTAAREAAVLRRRVWASLDAGARRFVRVLLQRERHWVAWKKETRKWTTEKGQKSVSTPRATLGVFRRRVCRKGVATSRRMGARVAGRPGWDAVKERAKAGRGGVKTLLSEVAEDRSLPSDERRKEDGKYVWRGLRVLCEEDVRLLARVADPDGQPDLERMVSASDG